MHKTTPFLVLLIAGLLGLFTACNEPENNQENGPAVQNSNPQRFKMLDGTQTGITFANTLIEDGTRNYFQYMYFYNGGGVAIGDLNNDGLPELFFTGNMVSDRLYLNKGNLKFEDITEKAGVGGGTEWHTGVTLADVNADGFLDIYVCRSGLFETNQRTNLLYINNQNLTFTESAAEYGLDDAGWSTQATFTDFDLDGDLDCYVLNHPIDFQANIQEKLKFSRNPDLNASDHLYLNQNGKFTRSFSKEKGIRNYGFGLSVTAADLNNDSRPDFYVANDFAEPDYLYLNRPGIGTVDRTHFEDKILESTGHISNFGMGVDIADLNNDGWLDILELDMMAEDNRRKKTNMSGMDPLSFYYNVDIGYHHQYMQNTLQLNLGDVSGSSAPVFAEVGELAGISQTDWSWAPLIADLDNDGRKDIFITNGIRRDVRDNDFVHWMEDQQAAGNNPTYGEVLTKLPEERIDNYVYQNQGDLKFEKKNAEWNLTFRGFSQGAAYADLDNDGDLDLVMNNLEDPAIIAENLTNELGGHHFLRVKIKGKEGNPNGLGTRVEVWTGGQRQVQELTLSRGFQSSVEPVLHFGLGEYKKVDSLRVLVKNGWSMERQWRVQKNIEVDQTVEIDPSAGVLVKENKPKTLFQLAGKSKIPAFQHQEKWHDDFLKESLLPHKYSQLGPEIVVADVNGDGLQDVVIGNGKGFGASSYLQNPNGSFKKLNLTSPEITSADVTGVHLAELDGKPGPDLLLGLGGENFPSGNTVFFRPNTGKGTFSNTTADFHRFAPGNPVQAIASGDFDGDGDLDLFIGGRNTPEKFPFAPNSLLLQNDGSGRFKAVTEEAAPGLKEVGMVTDAKWIDIDGDNDSDLFVVGEWMEITVYENEAGKLKNATEKWGLSGTNGWWYSLAHADLDGDGDQDLIAGNLGLNTKYKASAAEPFEVYAHDFDENGTIDIVLGYYDQGAAFPVRGRTCSSQQMPVLKQQFPTYQEFATATLRDVYGEKLDEALHYAAKTFETTWFRNDGGKFVPVSLPWQAQLAPVNAILVEDVNKDGAPDLILAGNMLHTEVETARHDAGHGLVLLGDGKGDFRALSAMESGFFAPGDVKSMASLPLQDGKKLVLVGVNDGVVLGYLF